MFPSEERPYRPAELFAQLFERDPSRSFERLSDGIVAIIRNAHELLNDADLLAKARRYERAEFLCATAQEEMGKAYMLVDMCRVDFEKRQDVLRRLCKAFYSHVLKHVYFDLSANEFPGIWELQQLDHYFRVSAKEWWPGSFEDGEPDLAHDTYFLREANLYVDYDSYANAWSVPGEPSKALLFEIPLPTPLQDTQAALERMRATHESKLFDATTLKVFNRRMGTLSITSRTLAEDLAATSQKCAEDIEKAWGISASDFLASQLCRWPMYWIDLKNPATKSRKGT